MTMTATAKPTQATYTNLTVGDPAPWFVGRTSTDKDFNVSMFGGRYMVLGFFGNSSDALGKVSREMLSHCRALFTDRKISFFGVTWTPADQEAGLVNPETGIRYVLDYDGAISRLYGVLPIGIESSDQFRYARRRWFVLDPQMRVIGVFPLQANEAPTRLFEFLSSLPPLERFAGFEMPVPVIAIPHVFEQSLCQRLIELYNEQGGKKSGMLSEQGGMTVQIYNENLKRRSDIQIKDREVLQMIQDRIAGRLFPEIEKITFIKCTRSERYIVGCYDSEDKGFFRQHRDNVSKGSAHRQFAASINLNSDFEGGELNFPEYGNKWFKLPPGAACVFSCALLHRVSPVTKGRRYAFLPFLYDDIRAKVREANTKFLLDGTLKYRANPTDNEQSEYEQPPS